MTQRISIFGLGKLGSCMAAAIADRGHHVIGMDICQTTVEAVNNGVPPVTETGLGELFARNQNRIQATESYQEAIESSGLSFVIVPTPSKKDGSFSLEYAADAFRAIGKALHKKAEYHIIVLTSTVLPGSMRYGLLPILEKESGKRCGVDFGLCYSPLFIALGSVIHNFYYPDFTLIGEFDRQAGNSLEIFYRSIVRNDSPCKRMSLENAEITKIALNTFVTTKVAFANMISDLCQNIPGGDIDTVTDALGTDTRIGPKYLKSGLGYGGPCFPRDNNALSFIARSVGKTADLADTTDMMNRQRPAKLLETFRDRLPSGAKVAILGLSYKSGTQVIDESQSIMLCEQLLAQGYKVIAYDPLVTKEVAIPPGIEIKATLKSCLQQAQAVFITTTEPQFAVLEAQDFTTENKNPTIVIDCWRILANKLLDNPGIMYMAPGISLAAPKNEQKLQDLWKHQG